MVESTEPVLLILADISGYTRFMTANAKTLAHSHTIITELINTIVRHAELPLRLAKLEGDAVFLYARKEGNLAEWRTALDLIGARLLGFFETFRNRVRELAASTTCTCSACSHLGKLELKVIVHQGEALFHEVAGFRELAGVDVILIHRLLKNSVPAHEYLLLTEAAARELRLPDGMNFREAVEQYPDLGRVPCRVHFPGGSVTANASHPVDIREGMRWHLKLWGGLLLPNQSARRQGVEPTSDPAGPARFNLALLAWVISPVALPVNLLQAGIRLWIRQLKG